MVCRECKNPLRIIGGGQKSDIGTNKITMVHIMGCMNPNCSIKLKEQDRKITDVPSFEG